MAEIDVGRGVSVRIGDDIDVRVVHTTTKRRGLRRGAESLAAATSDLLDALDAAGFAISAEIELAPSRPGTRAMRADAAQATEIEVQVSPTQSALVLVEGEGGVYTWVYPNENGPRPSGGRRTAQQTLVFSLTPPAASVTRGGPSRMAKRGIILDWIADKLVEPVRVYVLKFAVNSIVDVGVDYLEGDKPEGLISMGSDDVNTWRPEGSALPAWTNGRPANILLMIHGTFSSTAGGFGHLLLSESGRSFLDRARRKYDAILAFDHKTLVVDPMANADSIMDALEKCCLPHGSLIDAVAHSRGGLVYRTFAEQVLATKRPDIKLGKAVFVGCTNGGTHLAEPANWAAMIDLYTNAIMAGARAAVSFAGGGALSPLISTGIKTVGRFVQMFSEIAITDARVPGLAAMQPTSATVKGLNEAQDGLERLAVYYAVTSNFVARFEPRNGVTKELAEFVVDRITNRLFQVDNDLVVDTQSMVSFGSRKPRFDAGGVLAFGNTDDVYHIIYFGTDQLPSKLVEWLQFPPAEPQSQSVSRGMREGPDLPVAADAAEAPVYRRGRSDTLEHAGDSSLRTRGAPGPAVPRPSKQNVPCNFAAEMDPFPPLRKRVPLWVTISRDKIDVGDHAAASATTEPVKLDASRAIEVEVIAQKNCKIVGEAKVEVEAPTATRPEALRFDIEGQQQGEADLLVEARQGARILISFRLKPVFVDSDSKSLRVSQGASAGPDGAEQPAVLRIYEIVESGRVTLRFDLTCYNPNISVSESRTLPAGFSRDAYVAENIKEIENAWLGSNKIYDRFLLKLKANGIVMANELLPEKVRKALWQYRDAIRAIHVVSEEPFIPWELLYVTDPPAGPEGKGFLCEWGLVRWLHNTPWPSQRLAMNKDRVRYVIPAYQNPRLVLAGAAQEEGMLKSLFGNPKLVTPDSAAVAQFLNADAGNCDVLHFACHGEAAQRAVMRADLLMADTKVATGYVNDSLSAEVVKTHARFGPREAGPIVFINACQVGQGGAGLSSGVAGFVDAFLRPFSEQGADALVGALWSVSDGLAFTFAQTFYSALQQNRTLVEAARAAREAAKGQNDLTWLAYTVYGNPFARAGS